MRRITVRYTLSIFSTYAKRLLYALLISLVFLQSLSAFPPEILGPRPVGAINECDKFALDRGSYLADNKYCTCSTGTVSPQPTVDLSGATGPIFVLGDSITVMAANKYKSVLGTRGVPVEIDASGAGSITSAGTTGSKTSGLQAVQNKKDFISKAGTIVIALGTNGNNNTDNINKLIDSVVAINPSIKKYWVDTYITTNSSYNQRLLSTIKESNKAIYENATPKNYNVISWAKKVAGDNYDPIGMPTPQIDQNNYLSDGIHPNTKGIDALVGLVNEKLGSGQSSASVSNLSSPGNPSTSTPSSGTGSPGGVVEPKSFQEVANALKTPNGPILKVPATQFGGNDSAPTGGQYSRDAGDDNGVGGDGKQLAGRAIFAELSTNRNQPYDFSAMGKLPFGTKLKIKYGSVIIIAERGDIGRGPPETHDKRGIPYVIDLWYELANYFGFQATSDILIQRTDDNAQVTDIKTNPPKLEPSGIRTGRQTDASGFNGGGAIQNSNSTAVCCPVGSVAIQPLANTPAVDGNVQELAKQMLANPKITYWTNNGINTKNVVEALAAGKKGPVNAANASVKESDVNPNILKFILDAAQKGTVMVNAITDKTHSSGSKHYSGEALDLDLNTSVSTTELIEIAKKYGGTKNSEADHHHFDFPKSAQTSISDGSLLDKFANIFTGKVNAQVNTDAVVGGATNCAPCPTNGTGVSTILTGADNEEKVYRWLVSAGWSPAQSAGIVGNMTRESGVNPKRLEGIYTRDVEPQEAITKYPGGELRGYGLVQWTPVKKLINEVGVDKAGDMTVQLQYLQDQLDGKTKYPEKKAGDALKKETTPEQAAITFMAKYERPGVLATSERVAAAKRIFDKFSGTAGPSVGTGVGAASVGSAPTGCTSQNGSTVVVDGYAFPIGAPKKSDILSMPCKANTCHHDHSPAADLYHKDGEKQPQISKGWPVYAIQDGVIKNFKPSYKGYAGCPTWQLQSTDGWMYWYGHTDTPTVKEGDTVKAGQQIAVIGDYKCTGNFSPAHLHIDRGSPKGRHGGNVSARDPELIPILNKLYEALPQ